MAIIKLSNQSLQTLIAKKRLKLKHFNTMYYNSLLLKDYKQIFHKIIISFYLFLLNLLSSLFLVFLLKFWI